MSFTPRIFAASHDSRSRIGISPVLSGVCSLVPEPPVVTRQKTTSRPSRAQRATLPAIVNSLSSGCAEMQRMRVNSDLSVWGLRLPAAMRRLLAAHAEGRRPGTPERRGEVGELAEERARVARVDDLLDPEGLGRAERRAELVQPLLDLSHLRLRIRCCVEVGAIGGLDPALERQGAPAPRGPRVAHAVTALVSVRGAGDAERVA